ncbi:MAG TPA: molybdopterin dinucleotide binding domain-containing protein [Planctomycetota bacterium]|nr:molybdopterin dinucleotide binding domain-containing protein [Planctomycetota bacterium]
MKRCTLCPAGCELIIEQSGPDNWRTEYPAQNVGGLCPRGAVLGQLLAHRKRLTMPAVRSDGRLAAADLDSAIRTVLTVVGSGPVNFFLDGNVPVEEMQAVSAWCNAWEPARLCLLVEPADEAVLSGVASSGAALLSNDDLKSCDGFLVVGDVFSANPTVACGVFDRHAEQPRTPIVVIDPAAGRTSKFASLAVTTPVGMEYRVLAEVAKAAGVKVDAAGKVPSAVAAGTALARCRKLAVLLSAEYARSAAWRQIGHLAGTMAKQLGGGVMTVTTGANAAAAVNLAKKLGAISLADALTDNATHVALGCDLLGMLGTTQPEFAAVSAAFPNRTTESAQVILPGALSVEIGGSYLVCGKGLVPVPALLAPPAGTLKPSEVVAALAAAAGVKTPAMPAGLKKLEAIDAQVPGDVPEAPEAGVPGLLVGREPMHSGAGDVTRYGSWQRGHRPRPMLRISPADLASAGLKNEGTVHVETDAGALEATVSSSPELTDGVVVLSDGDAAVRTLLPTRVENGAVIALPSKVTLTS